MKPVRHRGGGSGLAIARATGFKRRSLAGLPLGGDVSRKPQMADLLRLQAISGYPPRAENLARLTIPATPLVWNSLDTIEAFRYDSYLGYDVISGHLD
jgi:hypothetical protein